MLFADQLSGRKAVIIQIICNEISLTFRQSVKGQLQAGTLTGHINFTVRYSTSLSRFHSVIHRFIIKISRSFCQGTILQNNSVQKSLLLFHNIHFFIFRPGDIAVIGIPQRQCAVSCIGPALLISLTCRAIFLVISIGQIFVIIAADHKIFYCCQTVKDRPAVQILIMLLPGRIQIHFIKKLTDTAVSQTEIISRAVGTHIHGRIIIRKSTILVVSVHPFISGIQYCLICIGFQLVHYILFPCKLRQIILFIGILIGHVQQNTDHQKSGKHAAHIFSLKENIAKGCDCKHSQDQDDHSSHISLRPG